MKHIRANDYINTMRNYLKSYNYYMQYLSNARETVKDIDGAGRWAKIKYITLPGIRPTIMILLLMNIGNILNAGFEIQYLLGNGLIKNVSSAWSWQRCYPRDIW